MRSRLAAIRDRLRRPLSRVPYFRRPAGAHHHDHPTFTEAELLARTEEFNSNAERHWRAITAEAAGRGHVLNKPLSTVQDTGPILYRLGLVLTELHLGIGHTVLDFAAGSCWLSSYLNRLRCRTVAVDVSQTALDLGRELFRLDQRHRLDLEPRFLAYDGHRLPLPDHSVDRIACFDAFHHVPNQDEVLAEFFRVLRPGGRVVFAEPGEGHSHMDQSLYEMERFGVLENDLHFEDVLVKARATGFSEAYVKPYPDASAITFRADDYLRFMEGRDYVFPAHVLRENLRHFLIFVLTKGEEVRDSRNPGVLRAGIEIIEPGELLANRGGGVVTARAQVRNVGDSLWLHEKDPLGGYVMLGAHLYDESGALLRRSIARAHLPRDVAPGEEATVPIELPLPVERGRYRVRFDMVDESLAWFEQFGSSMPEYPLTVDRPPDSRAPHRLGVRLERLDGGLPLRSRPGAHVSVPLRLVNVGDTAWLPSAEGAGTVAIAGHLLHDDQVLEWDFFRCPLPRAVPPEDSLETACTFAAPSIPGRYVVSVDLVVEGICWFGEHGSAPQLLAVEVSDEMPDSRQPGLLRAQIQLLEAPRAFTAAPGARLALPLRVLNTGNTLWLHEPRETAGHVALGGHLRDEFRRLLELDLFRTFLPGPVSPGESVDLVCELPMPIHSGRYVVELDLVDEGIAWFGSAGSPTVELEVFVS